ncbi:hypothetical protein [Kitasatospora sp. NPDC089509]|uniref:hypothetical protein n=1 Tax=Kitasatospora sp. NPDC089509 TaxID=3364079 RepID=UPI0037F520CE
MNPFLYHVHGIGPFDFSRITSDDLIPIQDLAAKSRTEIVPTIFLGRIGLPGLVDVLKAYDQLHTDGRLPNLAGFAVEGPMLGPLGGVPREGKWIPTLREWEALAELGHYGLRYIVMTPDALDLEDEVAAGVPFSDLLVRFYDAGVKVALGHYHHDDPVRSARRTRDVLTFLHQHYESSPWLVLTDHLFNDMPRAFVHAWRTPREREHREAELATFLGDPWQEATLAEQLGPVPAELLTATREGLVTPCLNFDGMHVDLTVCRRTVDYLGAERLIALTDHIEVDRMANERLRKDANGLWLREDGLVAAGSTGYPQQRRHMESIGLDESEITQLFSTNPRRAIYEPIGRRSR